MSAEKKNLLYISEVPVELSYAGATLVYRLLEQYPTDHLLILQTSTSINDNRLPGVRYIRLGNRWNKLVYILKRLNLVQPAYALDIFLKQRMSRRLRRIIRDFRPDAVVTVTFNLSWLTAYRISRRHKIPLLLLLHDDFLSTENYGKAQSYLAKEFGKIYRHAHGRFCIGPQMEAYYRQQYDTPGQVLYPSRGKNDITFRVDWENAGEKKSLNFCYAGSIGTTDFLPLLNDLAGILAKYGHTLTLFAVVPEQESLHKYEHLQMSHVRWKPLVHPDVLKKYMYEQADVNVLLNSFMHEDLFKLNFSSKIVDYSSVNLPVLFWGAPTSGIMNWALQGGYACVITVKDKQRVEEQVVALGRLAYRRQLADQLQKMSEVTFGFQKNYDVFTEQLR